MTSLAAVLDFIFPPRCGGCHQAGSWICGACRAQFRPARASTCARCRRLTAVTPCPLCAGDSGLRSIQALLLLDGPVRGAVHRMKYGERPQLANHLVRRCAHRISRLPEGALVPVPLGRERRRARGYNQAELLTSELARITGRSWQNGLTRTLEAAPQVGRAGSDRRLALRDAFVWTAPQVPDAIVLVDDVVTTGTTLIECARAASRAGVAEVHAMALALG